MKRDTIVAVPFLQGNVRLFSGVAPAGLLLRHGKVDVWRMSDNNGAQGYQREPERRRAKSVAKYLADTRALLPLSVMLSYRGKLSERLQEQSDGVVVFKFKPNDVLWIVDGQHRVEGFRVAVEEYGMDHLRDYPLPIVLVEGLTELEEAQQFQVINETAKKVRTDLARRLLYERAKQQHSYDRLIREQRTWEVRATEVLDKLLSDPQSPWRGRIQRPNEKRSPTHMVKELSFSNSLKPILTVMPYSSYEPRVIADLLIQYWRAWQESMPEVFENPSQYVLLKTPGVFSLHRLAIFVWEICRQPGKHLSKDGMKDVIADLGEYATPEYWEKDRPEGAAAFGSMKGFRILSDLMEQQLKEAGYTIEPLIE